jgi:hypothetical protein
VELTEAVMPAKAGIQYAVKAGVGHDWRGVLDHPLSRMMMSGQDARFSG